MVRLSPGKETLRYSAILDSAIVNSIVLDKKILNGGIVNNIIINIVILDVTDMSDHQFYNVIWSERLVVFSWSFKMGVL